MIKKVPLLLGILGHFFQYNKRLFQENGTKTLVSGCWDSLVVDEGVFIDGLYDELKRYLGGQGVAVLDHWFPIWAVPTVHYGEKRRNRRNHTPVTFILSDSTRLLDLLWFWLFDTAVKWFQEVVRQRFSCNRKLQMAAPNLEIPIREKQKCC